MPKLFGHWPCLVVLSQNRVWLLGSCWYPVSTPCINSTPLGGCRHQQHLDQHWGFIIVILVEIKGPIVVDNIFYTVSTPTKQNLFCKLLTHSVNTLIIQHVDTYQSNTSFGRCHYIPKQYLFWLTPDVNTYQNEYNLGRC